MSDARERVNAWRQSAREDPDGFWAAAAAAADQLPWTRRWDTVLDWQPPTFRWFVGGRTNLARNCIDRHIEAGSGARTALITENERGERRTFTYDQLDVEVRRVAAALRGLGIGKGDRIGIYMPTTAEAITLMLASTRIGAITSPARPGCRSPASRRRSSPRRARPALPGRRGSSSSSARSPGSPRRSGPSPSATPETTGRRSPATTCTSPETRRASTRRATSGSAAAPTRSSRSRTTASGRSRWRPHSSATPRSRSPA